MAKKRSLTNNTAEPPRSDDLKLINGIGPGVEKRLHGVGVFTYARLATLSPADIAAAVADLTGLSSQRITKQDWIGQARKLALDLLSTQQEDLEMSANGEQNVALIATLVEEDATPPEERYHAATFTIECLLDENNSVHHTHIVHVQSGREHTCTGWQSTQFEDFLSQSVRLNISSDKSPPSIVGEPEHAPVGVEDSKALSAVAAKPKLVGTLHLRAMETIGVESDGSGRILHHEQPFDVCLTLDLTELTVPGSTPLKYKASIYSKNLSNRSGQFVREAEGTLLPTDITTIDVKGNALPQGTYQLAATVILALPTMKLAPKPGSIAIIDGGLVQVY
ncbi:MAG: hypothetical protein NVSMB33_10160 [Ktedonobacteraceae bacterium]